MVRSLRISFVVFAVSLWCAAGAAERLTGFATPWYGMPIDIAAGPDGAMWFTDFDQIGRIDGEGVMSAFPLPPSSNPGGIALGPDSNLWFTEAGVQGYWGPTGWHDGPDAEPYKTPARIGRLTPSGVLTEFLLPTSFRNPSGQRIFDRIVAGADGNLWFTEQAANQIGRITISGVTTEFRVPTPEAGLSGIAAGPDGNVWFTEPGANRIGRITPDGAIAEFKLPGGGIRVTSGIAAGLDGNLWFTEAAPRIGRITPAGQVTEFQMPAASHRVVVGKDGHLWFIGLDKRLRRVSTTGAVTEYPFISIPGPLPNGIGVGPDGLLWLTSGDGWDFAGTIYRVAPGAGGCVADRDALCLNGGRFRVTANWKTAEGSTGSGRASPLTANTGSFWFFDPANLELIVKVLDGCSANGNFWMFAAGLTNVEVVMKVTDTWTGESREYGNAQGIAFAPIQDTAAFTACP